MILYVVKTIVCSAVFIAAYHLFLEREKTNTFKRFYLLGSMILAIVIPVVSVEILTEAQLVQTILPQTTETLQVSNFSIPAEKEQSSTTWLIVIIGYAFITCVLLVRFIKNIFSILKAARTMPLSTREGITLVISCASITPHTFLNLIFISEQDLRNRQILTHELTHARQWHTLDILFIELLQCIFWFNPLFIFYKKAIRLNHEFLADDSVIEAHQNVSGYQHLLLDKISGSKTVFASSFNYSITKKRFTMMTTLKNKQRTMIRIASALAVVLAASFLFANTTSAQTPEKDEYTIYKDGKWQNVQTTNTPGPSDIPAFTKGLLRAIRYPKSAKANGIEGDAAVMFEVDEKGQLANFSVVKNLQADCDTEVINAIKNAGATWKPAELDGKIYRTRFVLPVRFRFDSSKTKDSFQPASVQAKALNEVVVTTYRQTEK